MRATRRHHNPVRSHRLHLYLCQRDQSRGGRYRVVARRKFGGSRLLAEQARNLYVVRCPGFDVSNSAQRHRRRGSDHRILPGGERPSRLRPSQRRYFHDLRSAGLRGPNSDTMANGINAAGVITGWYIDPSFIGHGFLRIPILGFAGFCKRRCQRKHLRAATAALAVAAAILSGVTAARSQRTGTGETADLYCTATRLPAEYAPPIFILIDVVSISSIMCTSAIQPGALKTRIHTNEE